MAMQIDFKAFLGVVDIILDAKKPVMIRGRHGIGKSELIYQTAEKRGLPVVERRASQMTEGDLVGLPSLGDGRTSWNPPDWFKEACEKPVMLFLDEVDRATIEVRQGIFELTDSRKLNGFQIHEDTLVVAAVNGGEEGGGQYQVGEMDPAELDRWTVFDVAPSVEDWLTWARGPGKINNVVMNFINQNHDHLENKGEFSPNKKYPSRRSWARFAHAAEKAGMFEEFDNKIRILASGFVGHESAMAFADFFQKYGAQVKPEDILDKGKHKLVKDFQLVDHIDLIEKMKTKELLKKELSDKQIKNLTKYFVSLPSEAAMKLWTALADGPAKNTINVHQTPGFGVGDFLAEILNGQSGEG